MLETPALSRRCRVAQTPGPARGLCSASPESPKQRAATQRLASPTAAQPPALELGPARLSRRPSPGRSLTSLLQPLPACSFSAKACRRRRTTAITAREIHQWREPVREAGRRRGKKRSGEACVIDSSMRGREKACFGRRLANGNSSTGAQGLRG